MKKLFLSLALLFLSVPGWSATYYVRTDGHDTATGVNDTNNSTTGAWLTIGKGASTASAGDTVIINNGTYANGLVTFSRSGSAGNMITFRAANNRQAQLTGGFKITGNYVKVDGLKVVYASGITTSMAWTSGNNNEIRNNWIANDTGGNVDVLVATGSNNLLDNNLLTNCQQGIRIQADNNVVSNNEVSGLTWWGPGGTDADYSRFFGTNHSFINNYFHGADPAVLYTHGAHVDCFQTFDDPGPSYSINNVLIDGNRCYDAHQGVMSEATVYNNSSGLTLRNNVFSNMLSWMLALQHITNVYIYNNTFYNGTKMGVGALGSTTILALRNNIFYNSSNGFRKEYFVDTGGYFATYNDGSITNADHNLLYKTSGRFTQGDYPSDIVNMNPNFVSSSDYHLQAGSPAIDKGSTISGFSSDILGVSRPQGAAWDIGAYEFIVIPPVNPPVNPQIPSAPKIIMIN